MKSQLVFLYIHDYQNIRETGFNLSSDYSFELQVKQHKDGFNSLSLKVELNESTVPGLFNPGFTDVIALVGENGSGKSTLLQYLAFHSHHHHNYMKQKGRYKDIALYEIENDVGEKTFRLQIGLSWEPFFKINLSGFEYIGPVKTDTIADFSWSENLWEDTAVIYYSNTFDNKFEENGNGLINLSTNFLLRNDYFMENFTKANEKIEILSQADAHLIEEQRRRIAFAIDFKGQIPFMLPDELHITVSGRTRSDLEKKYLFLNADKRKYETIIFHFYKTWIDNTSPEKMEKSDNRAFIHKAFLDYFILNFLLDSDISFSRNKIFNEYRTNTFHLILDLFDAELGIANFDELLQFMIKLEQEINDSQFLKLGTSKYSVYLEPFIKLDMLMQPYYNRRLIFSKGFSIPVSGALEDIFNQYSKTVFASNFLDFTFPGLSSGELSFLSLFSRFYSLTDKRKHFHQEIEPQNLLILLDEPDVYFHPKWQVRFLSFINDLFPLIFPRKHINLILTTHSPFITSDLPLSNILFLKKGTQEEFLDISGVSAFGLTVLGVGPERTFGANVHELLSESFFLEGAHIGNLARDVIFKVVDQLEGSQVENPYAEAQLERIISQVGEPWVKSRLEELYLSYRGKGQRND